MTNQDSPNTAGAAEPVAWMIETRDERWLAFEHENPDAIAIPFTETPLYTHPPENPPQRPSVVPDEVVEAILFNVEHVCGPLNTEPCVILGDDDRSVLASAIRAALIAERDRLAARCERLEEALLTIKHEAERENGRWVHLKRCIAVQTKAALKEPSQ